MEQGNPKRKVNTHDKVLNIIGKNKRHCMGNGVCDLGEDPIHMQEYDCTK